MNKLEKMAQESKNVRDTADLHKLYHKFNCVRINPANSYNHELAKFKESYNKAKLAHLFATEVVSKDHRRRYDFVDFTELEIKEFESDKKIKKEGATTVSL